MRHLLSPSPSPQTDTRPKSLQTHVSSAHSESVHLTYDLYRRSASSSSSSCSVPATSCRAPRVHHLMQATPLAFPTPCLPPLAFISSQRQLRPQQHLRRVQLSPPSHAHGSPPLLPSSPPPLLRSSSSLHTSAPPPLLTTRSPPQSALLASSPPQSAQPQPACGPGLPPALRLLPRLLAASYSAGFRRTSPAPDCSSARARQSCRPTSC